jgi:hypothetical protein
MLVVTPYTIISHDTCPFFVAFLCLCNNNCGITLKKDPKRKSVCGAAKNLSSSLALQTEEKYA